MNPPNFARAPSSDSSDEESQTDNPGNDSKEVDQQCLRIMDLLNHKVD